MKLRLHLLVLCVIIIFLVYNMASFQHKQTSSEAKSHPFDTVTVSDRDAVKLPQKAEVRIGYLPHGIVESNSDMKLKPLWLTTSAQSKKSKQKDHFLIAIAAGINQKKSVDAIMKKFLPENFTAVLFHYDGNVNGWNDLPWSKSVIHIAASNQTKWWFAKRFLHPAVVSMYQYIFLWDEDLEVDNFNPRRYLNIVRSEGLEISQPGLDSKLSEIHHRITVRKNTGTFHRVSRANKRCLREGPPCSGWVEGMAPVFSKYAWQCVWHLIQVNFVLICILNHVAHLTFYCTRQYVCFSSSDPQILSMSCTKWYSIRFPCVMLFLGIWSQGTLGTMRNCVENSRGGNPNRQS
ncbi:bromodomain 4 [Zea mays]|uniref:Bromodomain 4 n=1 Tax=Zea mays TaxID=4577 RepID=A0A1D6EYC5_MAIZE|nr:bromodomain 4 [Zea mays]